MYQFGQFRSSQTDSYSVSLEMDMGRESTERSSSQDVIFYNICGNLSGNNIVNNQNSYYLQFEVKERIDSAQKFYLKLKNKTQSEDNEQLIEEFNVPAGNGVRYFEITFTPNATYNEILWELQRTALDYQLDYGRLMNITVKSFTRLINIISTLKQTYSNMNHLTKIGIQGPPSLLMCINGEQIRIGKSGIYEINNDVIKITSISFVPKQATFTSNEVDYFIMDFEYN